MKTISAIYTPELEAAIKSHASHLPIYPVECHEFSEDFEAIRDAISQGIDSHLEAIRFTEFSGQYGKRGLAFNPETLHVLIRRLMESENDAAQSLASAICETIGVELI